MTEVMPGPPKEWLEELRETVPSSALMPPQVLRSALAAMDRCRAERSVTTLRICFVKELFNFYFRDDLYGDNRRHLRTLLSSGSADETVLPAPRILKHGVRVALDRDWYGYSDSRGRMPVREAIAALESVRLQRYIDPARVLVTQGGTAGLTLVADCVLAGTAARDAPVLCATPAYAPHIKAIVQRASTQVISIQEDSAHAPDLGELIAALRADTPLILIQTVINPSGSRVPEESIERLIRAAPSRTLVLLDEAHEPIGGRGRSPERAAPNVVRLVSLSKDFSVPGMKLGWITASASLVEQLYEYASTNYGGPPSVFSLAVESVVRFERWRLDGKAGLHPQDYREFDAGSRAALGDIGDYYADYLAEREAYVRYLDSARAMVADRLSGQVLNATDAVGVNLSLRIPSTAMCSYAAYRGLLTQHGISVFPGVLMSQTRDAECRLTLARPHTDLREGVDALERWYAGAI